MTTERDEMLSEIRDELTRKFHSEDSVVADVAAYLLGVHLHSYLHAIRTPASHRSIADHINADLAPHYLPLYNELVGCASAHQLREVIKGMANSVRCCPTQSQPTNFPTN